MYSVDIASLKQRIDQLGYSVNTVAKLVNVSSGTFGTYLKTPEKIPYSVLCRLILVLGITKQEATEIFFHSKLT